MLLILGDICAFQKGAAVGVIGRLNLRSNRSALGVVACDFVSGYVFRQDAI